MGIQIEDGKGRGNIAEVDGNNRVTVRSIMSTEAEQATRDGDSYNLNTGKVVLTTAGSSAVMYLKNNEDRDININSVITIFGPTSNGAAGSGVFIRIIKNPENGTIVTDSSNVAMNSNRNFGSGKTFTVDAYVGSDGSTITDGSDHIQSIVSPGNRVVFDIDEILPKGKSIGVIYQPPVGNEAMETETATDRDWETID